MSVTTVVPESVRALALIDVNKVAGKLGCSPRHVYRLSDAGRMPPPVRLGALVRWSESAIDEWIDGGCKPVRSAGRPTR